MKPFLILAAASVLLSSCGALAKSDILGVNDKATAEAQKIKAEADARLTDAVIRRLDTCGINGMLNFKAQLAPDAGLTLGSGLNCEPKPWNTPTTDPEIIGRAIDAAVDKALDKRFGPAPQP
jgi:hypothetical protein